LGGNWDKNRVEIVGKPRPGIKRRIYIICKKGSEKKLKG
jgi:hypothetical protein